MAGRRRAKNSTTPVKLGTRRKKDQATTPLSASKGSTGRLSGSKPLKRIKRLLTPPKSSTRSPSGSNDPSNNLDLGPAGSMRLLEASDEPDGRSEKQAPQRVATRSSAPAPKNKNEERKYKVGDKVWAKIKRRFTRDDGKQGQIGVWIRGEVRETMSFESVYVLIHSTISVSPKTFAHGGFNIVVPPMSSRSRVHNIIICARDSVRIITDSARKSSLCVL